MHSPAVCAGSWSAVAVYADNDRLSGLAYRACQAWKIRQFGISWPPTCDIGSRDHRRPQLRQRIAQRGDDASDLRLFVRRRAQCRCVGLADAFQIRRD